MNTPREINDQQTFTEDPSPFLLVPEKPRHMGVLVIHGFTATPAEVRGLGERIAAEGYPVLGDIAVLTNGVIWWFYLASSNGSWQQKWFFSADFFTQEPDTFVPQLVDLLTMNKVSKGQALKTAKNLLRDKKQKMAERSEKQKMAILSEK